MVDPCYSRLDGQKENELVEERSNQSGQSGVTKKHTTKHGGMDFLKENEAIDATKGFDEVVLI